MAYNGPPSMWPQQQGGPNKILELLRRPGVAQGLRATGMGMMAQSDQPNSSLLGNLGRALPGGFQAYEGVQKQRQYDDMLQGMDPGMAQVLGLLSPEQGAAFMAQEATRQPQIVPEGASVYRNGNFEQAPIRAGAVKPPDLGDTFGRHALEVAAGNASFQQTFDPRDLTTEERSEINRRMQEDETARARAGVAPQEDKLLAMVQASAWNQVVESAEAAETAQAALTRVARVRQTLDESGVEPYTGFFAPVRENVDRVLSGLNLSTGDRAAMTQQMDLFFKTNALDIIQAFAGQLSDRELAAAQFLAGDKSMEQVTLGLVAKGEAPITSVLEAFQLTAEATQNIYKQQSEVFMDRSRRNTVEGLLGVFNAGAGGSIMESTNPFDSIVRPR